MRVNLKHKNICEVGNIAGECEPVLLYYQGKVVKQVNWHEWRPVKPF